MASPQAGYVCLFPSRVTVPAERTLPSATSVSHARLKRGGPNAVRSRIPVFESGGRCRMAETIASQSSAVC